MSRECLAGLWVVWFFLVGFFLFIWNYNNLCWWIQLCSPVLFLCVYKITDAKGPCELSGLGKNLIVICIFGNAKFPLSKWMGLHLWMLFGWGQSSWRLQADKPAVFDYGHKVRCLGHGSQRSDNSLQLCFRLLGYWKASYLESLCLKLVISILHSLQVSLVPVSTVNDHIRQTIRSIGRYFWVIIRLAKNILGTLIKKMLNNPLRMCWIYVHTCAYMQKHT